MSLSSLKGSSIHKTENTSPLLLKITELMSLEIFFGVCHSRGRNERTNDQGADGHTAVLERFQSQRSHYWVVGLLGENTILMEGVELVDGEEGEYFGTILEHIAGDLPEEYNRAHLQAVDQTNASASSRSSPATQDIYTRVDFNYTELTRAYPARLTVIVQVTMSKLRAAGGVGTNGHWKSKLYAKKKQTQ
ncbi:hypothetical protein EVAR_38118_1 [Eumeta japonica]|uniref:Uncharacterized protein n=1 Tax=Eumeta variegata TaxID=151549 RepID=A0A4C1X8U7_EUMVA|nr:hypothetical protein EVAR_38118_1 [Eumeta japonica]